MERKKKMEKCVSVGVPAVLAERIQEYVERDPELYHSREQFVLDAIENYLGEMLDVEDDKLHDRIWSWQARGISVLPPKLREQIGGYLKNAKKEGRIVDHIKTTDDFIRHCQKYNRAFQAVREEKLRSMVLVDREKLDKVLAAAEKYIPEAG